MGALTNSCDECSQSFNTCFALKSHIDREHKEKRFSCHQCDKSFPYQKWLDVHIGRKHLQSRNVPCTECPKYFFDKGDLKDHFTQVHQEDRPFACKECPATFKRSSGYNSHKNTHKTTKDFECPICGKAFKVKTSVEKCVVSHNYEGKPVACYFDKCDSMLKTPELLRNHIKRIHTDKSANSLHVCQICTKSFKESGELTRHTNRVHLKVEPNYQCSVCPRKAYTHSELQAHMNIHNGDTFVCWHEGCSSKSNTKYGINYHFKKKHGKVQHRPGRELKDPSARIPCELCGSEVKAGNSPAHSMKLHMEIHKFQTPLKCPIESCSAEIYGSKVSYTFPIQMYSHIERVHGIPFKLLSVNFKCKLCGKTLIGRHHVKASYPYGASWKDLMKRHIKVLHEERIDDSKSFAQNWDKNFEKSELVFEDDTYENEEHKTYIENNLKEIYMNIVNKIPVVTLKLIKSNTVSYFLNYSIFF